MTCSKQDWQRALDFSAIRNADAAMASAILRLLHRRRNAQTRKDITGWFRATPESFISTILDGMVATGQIQAGRSSLNRKRWVLEYFLPEEVAVEVTSHDAL